MSVSLSSEALSLLSDHTTVKILATVDGDGVPHAVVKQSLHADDDGRRLYYLELLDTSATNRNLVRGIWYDGRVAVTLAGSDGRSIQIKGRPVKNHVTGPLFAEQYRKVRDLYGDVDLAGVWEIEPEEVIDQSIGARRTTEAARHPAFVHLDRIARA